MLTDLIGTANVQIMNLRRVKPTEPYDFRIDRPHPLSNPIKLMSEEFRSDCISKFKTIFHKDLVNRPEVKAEIDAMLKAHHKHGIVRLFCWCHPKQCHGEVIREYLIYLLE